MALDLEASEWEEFRKALDRDGKRRFEEVLHSSRLCVSASSMATRTSKFEGMFMAMLLHHFRGLSELRTRLEEIE